LSKICTRGKVKRRKEKGATKRGVSTLVSHDDTRQDILWWRAHAGSLHMCLFTQSPPLVTPLGDLYGNSSRKFMILCAGASGGEDDAMGLLGVSSPFLK